MCYNSVLSNKIKNDATVEPVSIDDFKLQYAKIDFPEEDQLIAQLLKAARHILEQRYNIDIISKTRSVIVNNSCGMIDLPGGPIKNIVDESNYKLIDQYLKYPISCEVSIEYESGYDISDVPDEYKIAIMSQALYMFENRGDNTENKSQISPEADSIMCNYSRNTLGMWL
ncbi:MAG: hypothetical protein WB562_00650 [Candidatus Sulfotelmatobacter sp.]